MKKLLLLLMSVIISMTILADNQVLQILLADGETVYLNLNEEPVTTYEDGKLVIKTTKASVSYPIENVRRFTYGHTDDAQSIISLSEDGETFTFKGLKRNTDIAVYTISGQLVRRMNTGNNSNVSVSVSKLPQGVYVVKTGNATFKISKR